MKNLPPTKELKFHKKYFSALTGFHVESQPRKNKETEQWEDCPVSIYGVFASRPFLYNVTTFVADTDRRDGGEYTSQRMFEEFSVKIGVTDKVLIRQMKKAIKNNNNVDDRQKIKKTIIDDLTKQAIAWCKENELSPVKGITFSPISTREELLNILLFWEENKIDPWDGPGEFIRLLRVHYEGEIAPCSVLRVWGYELIITEELADRLHKEWLSDKSARNCGKFNIIKD